MQRRYRILVSLAQKIDDRTGYGGVERITVIDGSHCLFKHIMLKSAGKIIQDTNSLHRFRSVKNLFEYNDDFPKTCCLK